MKKPFTVDTSGESYVVQSYCSYVIIRDYTSAAAYTVLENTPSSSSSAYQAGIPYEFWAPPGTTFVPGQVLGTFTAASGSIPFVAEESGRR